MRLLAHWVKLVAAKNRACRSPHIYKQVWDGSLQTALADDPVIRFLVQMTKIKARRFGLKFDVQAQDTANGPPLGKHQVQASQNRPSSSIQKPP